MAPVIVLEVVDARGLVRDRVRLSSFPALVGRGYEGDVILDDPYVCARHLRIALDDDGRLVAHDEGSVNGTWLHAAGEADGDVPPPAPARVEQVALHAGTELRVGRTLLRVRTPADPVPPALRDAHAGAVPATLHASGAPAAPRRAVASAPPRFGAPVGVGLVAGVYALFVLFLYLRTYQTAPQPTLLVQPLAWGWALALWAGVWALANRAVAQRFNFVQHLAVVSVATLAVTAIMELEEWARFLDPASELGATLLGLPLIGVVLLMLWWHLGIASATRRTRWIWAGGATGGLIALGGLVAVLASGSFTGQLEDPGAIKPAGAPLARTVTLDAFTSEAAELQSMVDSLARLRPEPVADSAGAGDTLAADAVADVTADAAPAVAPDSAPTATPAAPPRP